MTRSELEASWERTTAFLKDGRAHLSEAAEDICTDEINDFDEFLEHNELELALDSLELAVEKSGMEIRRVMELMLKAAQNMGLSRRVERYTEKLKD